MSQIKDTSGRYYLSLHDAKQDMIVELDAGFTCRRKGRAMLYSDPVHGLYFHCKDGSHCISGQADDGIHCVGIYPTTQAANV